MWQGGAYDELLGPGGLYGSAFGPAAGGFCSGVVYDLDEEEPTSAAQAGFIPVSGEMAGQQGAAESLASAASPDDAFASEVLRITNAGDMDYRGVLGLQSHEGLDLQSVLSKYRRLMRLLHPDKRREDEVARAGGRERCDEALRLVQQAAASAKKELQPAMPQQRPVPTSESRPAGPLFSQHVSQPMSSGAEEVHSNLRRVQEVQRQQARQAMQRHQSGPNVESLLEDISQVLGPESAAARRRPAEAPPSNSTTAQLMGLLANLRQQG